MTDRADFLSPTLPSIRIACIVIDDLVNKVTFKRTRSLSNAVCFKHNNNVCACAVSALTLRVHLVANLSPEIDSETTTSYMTGNF